MVKGQIMGWVKDVRHCGLETLQRHEIWCLDHNTALQTLPLICSSESVCRLYICGFLLVVFLWLLFPCLFLL